MGKTIEKIMDDLWNGWSLDNREDFKTLDDRLKQIDALTARAEAAEKELKDELARRKLIERKLVAIAPISHGTVFLEGCGKGYEEGGIYDSPQAEEVRKLRAERDEAKEQLKMADAAHEVGHLAAFQSIDRLASLAAVAQKVSDWWEKVGYPMLGGQSDFDALKAELEKVTPSEWLKSKGFPEPTEEEKKANLDYNLTVGEIEQKT
jgi:hypothetical protein